MAVVIEERFCTNFSAWTKEVHHRNPSGLNNKVKFLLEKSKRDPITLDNLCKNKINRNPGNKESYASWIKAEFLALECIESGVSDPRDLYLYKKAYKLFPHLHGN